MALLNIKKDATSYVGLSSTSADYLKLVFATELPWGDTTTKVPAIVTHGVDFLKGAIDQAVSLAKTAISESETANAITFTAGEDGSFSYKVGNGTATKVSIGKPSTAGTADYAYALYNSAKKLSYDATSLLSAFEVAGTKDTSGWDGITISIGDTTKTLYPTGVYNITANKATNDEDGYSIKSTYVQNSYLFDTDTSNNWTTVKISNLPVATTISNTSSQNSDSTIPTTLAVYNAITSGIRANDSMRYKGTLGTGGTVTSLPTDAVTGDTYKVITAGTYNNVVCEVGDTFIAYNNGTTLTWHVLQNNVDFIEATINGNTTPNVKFYGSGLYSIYAPTSLGTKGLVITAGNSSAVWTTSANSFEEVLSSDGKSVTGLKFGTGLADDATVTFGTVAYKINISGDAATLGSVAKEGLLTAVSAENGTIKVTVGGTEKSGTASGNWNINAATADKVNQALTAGEGLVSTGATTYDGSTALTFGLTAATSEALGGIKLGATADDTKRIYPVMLNSSNQAYVNVDWVNTWRPILVGGTVLNASIGNLIFDAGDGLVLNATPDANSGSITISYDLEWFNLDTNAYELAN